MVQLIVGKKGKGKTKHLLDKVNSEVQQVPGSIVYLDKSTKHMYELNNKIRLIDVSSYFISDRDTVACCGERWSCNFFLFHIIVCYWLD